MTNIVQTAGSDISITPAKSSLKIVSVLVINLSPQINSLTKNGPGEYQVRYYFLPLCHTQKTYLLNKEKQGLHMIAEYRKNHKDKQRPHNACPDENTCRNGKAHLGTGNAE